ncbi:putative quinol monooxygenase [Deinococcus koreensis]|uniref:Antibiotic biosynthesis monooxygenase n=1 Tax=Deinococcus koreensis TaxID=2054903 RepID=A0A2K3URR9_9DEIO|nr:putative quinol monooxygenase [Deinococcus koreensis]PNY79239.1 antibiotic biosynthesis monooxygenase [Deinococcus koreensis]
MAAVNLFATLVPKSGQAEALRAGLLTIAPASRTEPGCLRYEVLESGEGTSVRFHVVERFVDDAAVQAHGQSGHYRVFSASFETWLAGPPHVVRSRNLDVGE